MHTAAAALRLDDDLARRAHADALDRLLRGEVRFGVHDRLLYATDASIYQVEPIGVVIPADLDDLRAAVTYCAEHGLPMLPRGGGTSLAGQGVARAVVFDLSPNFSALDHVDPEHRTCRVRPGLSIDDLNDRLRALGHALFFAPDPATARQCAIGGAIGNNAAGTRSIKYGRTSESLVGVDVMLASGEEAALAEGSARTNPVARRLALGVIDVVQRHEGLIRERFPKTIRRNAGYALDMMLEDLDQARARGADPLDTFNLAHLICGSEGTLAFVTGATLTLHPVPKAKGLAVVGFDSLEAAIDCVVPILSLAPSAVELLDDLVISLARQNIEYRRYVELMPQPAGGAGTLDAVLYVEFFSDAGPAEIEGKFGQLRALVARLNPRATITAYADAPSMAQALKLRKAGEPLLHAIPGSRKPLGFVEDNAVPVERLAEFVRAFRAIVARHGTRAAFWAHASVGVLHVRPLLDLRDPADRAHMEQIAVEVADLARSLGGVMSGEHGDGRVRGPLLERHFGPELMGAFREIKALFDPRNLLNPGNIVTPGPIASIHEATRVRPTGFDLHAAPIDTFFDYSSQGGIDHAVELCNGSGVCRKKQGGTMCPSYMATLDERHSTRGRANALRLAITGQFASRAPGAAPTPAPPLWGDPETLATLNLCLSCKACKSECPTNVDVAQDKAEYLAQTYRAAGHTPLKALAFGNVRLLNRVGSALAPLSNWVANSALHRALVNPVLGLARQRTLPAFAPSLYRQARRAFPDARWIPSAPGKALAIGPDAQDARTVILFPDCFTTYNEPHIGLATITVLVACGYRVLIPRSSCCGRAQISTGLLDEARRSAAAAARTLLHLRRAHPGACVVACEPSCLSAIKDEWQKLRLDAPAAPSPWRSEGSTVPDARPIDPSTFRDLAEHAFLPEDFIDRAWDTHPQRPTFNTPRAGCVALHGHCHQKALWGEGTSARFLKRVVGERLRVLDTGCCGMAGSFGYTEDRYDLSMRIGELTLFPQVRALDPGALVIAPGTSCRHQIHDGVACHAIHPMELVASLLRVGSR